MAKKKIAMLTGGGDAPGLNAVICSFVRACLNTMDYDIIGYRFGYRGLYRNEYIPLDRHTTSGILRQGGTILFNSNKDNLFDYSVEENGVTVKKDVSDQAIETMKKENVHALVVLGGDGTLTSARDFARKGVNVIGVPKTIDNDLPATEVTFGFDTAVNTVAENLGRLHTTAESHHRIMVAEVMGRSAGWIALYGGIAGSADVILIPEIPYTIENIVKKINERKSHGKEFTIICVTEGAIEKGGSATIGKIVKDSPDAVRFGGVAAKIAHQLEQHIENEVRHCLFGHIQRGGDTSPADRILSARYGVKAAQMVKEGQFGNMVCLRNGQMEYVSLEDVIGDAKVSVSGSKTVDPNGEMVRVAKSMGISFADE
ncbi:MAG: ATP-dependent 6-phosphofructokinase [Defluviitaleaceae bacterium]|nr:ATP-dependent 6-phosphofructokinase [Defluviitaleaceae bacterium]MCL2203777.1 ATP-dependent 6-phosphofructokinase [Defluviitaleaceae bacterium]MCL2239246.1 ATP-dependent 6-phosphofructokinase [Defluviitaleaceae bacterium]